MTGRATIIIIIIDDDVDLDRLTPEEEVDGRL